LQNAVLARKLRKKRISEDDLRPLIVAAVIAGLLFAGFAPGCSDDPECPTVPDNSLPYVTPEDVGWSSQELEDAEAFAAQTGYAAVMALYDGKVFFAWGEVERDFLVHSIRKPFMSALIGIHAEEGDIDLDATMEDLGIDDIPPSLTTEEKQATVRDLIMSRSGIYHEAAAESDTMIALRPERGSHPPGTFFYYNNWDFNAAGAIFEQETGTGIFEAFEQRIAGPIGMEDFDLDSCYYRYEPAKSQYPAYHFRMSARDLARFGVLYQQNGVWRGRRLVPDQWVTESTKAWSVEDTVSGVSYGYMWRVIPDGSPLANMFGYSAYFHTGVGVQALVVVPDLKLVIVELYNTDGNWTDPGEVGIELGMMIINARITTP
jgi:CubicO group peptidase (beta-lactamase class C family)